MSQHQQPFWILEITSNNKTYTFDLRSLFSKTNFESKLIEAWFEDNPEPIYNSEFIQLKELIVRLIPEVFERSAEIFENHPEKKVLYHPESQYLCLDEIIVENYKKLTDTTSYCEIDILVELYGFKDSDEPTYLYDTRGMICFSYKIENLTTVLSLEIDDME